MRYFLMLAFFICTSALLHGQSFWAQGTGGADADETMGVCFDNTGNIISAGYFTSTAAFGSNTSLTSASVGIPDIYVSKSNSSGAIQWAVRAGGIGSDRALSVKCDASGNIYITGFYYSSATFGSFTLNSAGSQDIFIAKLDSSGKFLWAVSAGGNMADIGNAIDVDAAGNVLVSGQFQGTASWGIQALTSMVNPKTNLPSIDIFTAKYDNSGNFLWVRGGMAKYTDRALAIASDASGNVYVCGQFSDTILFNQVHNNPIMNAIFLIKYDASGHEVWFRKASGTYSIAYALLVNNDKDIYMTGDFQGNLAFYGPPNNFVSDTYSKCVFLAKYDTDGKFAWASSESSDNYISSRAVTLDPNGDPYIAGEFGCTLNKFADAFGQGNFNSIGYGDIFTAKYTASSGKRQWMRNFGGAGNDQVHGILAKAIDNPIIAGSYEKKIYWADNSLNVTTGNSVMGLSTNNAYCSEASYGTFQGMKANGFSDGFIAQAVDISRQPYDYYHRTGSACLRDFAGGCIDSAAYPFLPMTRFSFTCTDTMRFCGTGYLFANTHTGSGIKDTLMPPYYDYYSVGPNYNFKWSSSAFSTISYIDTITVTNTYTLKMTTVDGCYSSADTIYAIVNPIPLPPTITDDQGINTNQSSCAKEIEKCRPDTILLIGGNIQGNSISWYQSASCFKNTPSSSCALGGIYLVSNDSLSVSSDGYYNVVLTNQYGCKNSNCVPVDLDTVPPDILPKSRIPDTIVACYGSKVYLEIFDSLSGTKGPFDDLHNNWSSTSFLSIYDPWPDFVPEYYLGGQFIAQTSGTYIVTDSATLSNLCGTKIFPVTDTFYLQVNPLPIMIPVDQTICPGQVATLTASGGISYFWYGTGQTTSSIVATPAITTEYEVSATNSFGCTNKIKETVFVYPNPVIKTVPASGLICPNDSVQLLSDTPGTNFQWTGPNGILPFNTQFIYQNVPGFYHCIVTNLAGCVLPSNTVELKQYNTPYLLPVPTNAVCEGETVTLQVITNDTTLIQWNPPLSGGGVHQTVNQSGVYTCNVTMCGITTLCSMPVIVSQPIAHISAPPITCPGDTVLMTANTGMASYQWTPGNSLDDTVYVQAGTYLLTTIDENGCTANASITIALDTSVTKPSASDTSLCAGTSATLYATGSGLIEWYSSSTSTTPIYAGSPFITPQIDSSTTFFAATSNSAGCHSLRDSAVVTVIATSLLPDISITDTICGGGTILCTTPLLANAIYLWTGPNGFSSSQQNPVIPNASTANSGTYTLVVSGDGCTSPPAIDTVTVSPPVITLLDGTDTLCTGDSISLAIINPASNVIYTWNGPYGFSSTGVTIKIYPASVLNSGTYSAYGTANGCTGPVTSFMVFVNPTVPPTILSSNNPVCEGEYLYLIASGGGNYSWSGPSGFHSSQPNPTIFPAGTQNAGTYTVTSTLNGCPGDSSHVDVTVNPKPELFLGADTAICRSHPLTLSPQGSYSSYLWYDNSTENNHVIEATGLYFLTVTNSFGCKNSDSINIQVVTCDPTPPTVFTPNGDGMNDHFTFNSEGYRTVKCEIFDRWGRKIYSWDDPTGGWDGTDTHNQRVSEGTYYYVAHLTGIDDKKIERSGFIDLLR